MPAEYQINHLVKRYDNDVLAVNDLTLEVQAGEIYCMLGANGAGKTTTLMISLGFTPPTSGSVCIHSYDIQKEPLEAKRHVAYVSENVQLYGAFSALQNLRFFAELAGKKDPDDEELLAALNRVGLPAAAHRRRVHDFSKGMRQRVGIAIAILREAKVILLDEPTSGLDPKGGLDLMNLLNDLKNEDRAIFMTTHDIFRAREIADHLGIMVNGQLVTTMQAEDIRQADLTAIYTHYIEQGAG